MAVKDGGKLIPYYDAAGEKYPLTQYEDFCITHEQDGFEDCLQFALDPKTADYQHIEEEGGIVYGGNNWLVKKINDEAIECYINFNFLKERVYVNYSSDSVTLSALLQSLLPSDYSILNANITSIRRTINKDYATPYEILKQAMSTYDVYFEWQTAEKTVTVHSASALISSGEYVSDELNLKALSFCGDTTNFATRLYPYGKDGMTIADVNNGKEYVENHTFSRDIVCAYWSDERYTIVENLRDDAQERLDKMVVPTRTYECDVDDLAKSSPDKYAFLAFILHRVITLIDHSRSLRVDHKIVQYKEYPEEPSRNKVTLSGVQEDIKSYMQSAISDYEESQLAKGEEDWMNERIMIATALLTNAAGTYPFTDEDGNFYLADNENLQAAKSVWIFNKNGMGHSSTGVEGPYTTSWTFDGKFISDLMYAMTVRADRVIAGRLQDIKGNNWWNLDTGELHLSSSATVDGESLEDKYYTKNEVDVTANGITTKITQEITDRQNAVKKLQSSIEQNASAIKLKVSSSAVESLIEQKADSIRLKASKISWSSTYSSMTENGILSCSKAEISGMVKCGSNNGYWIQLQSNGRIGGGYGSSQYGYMDYSAASTNSSTGETYRGLQIQGGILRISCPVISVRALDSVGSTTFNGYTGALGYIRDIVDNGNGTITWTKTWINFENGLMVSDPN